MKTNRTPRVTLVTGASSGIGAETARLFALAGGRVYGASRRGTAPDGVIPLVMDVTSGRSVSEGVAEVLRRESRLDVLIHAAGGGLAGPVEVSTAGDAHAQMDAAYFGALRLLNAALPVMRRQKEGRIILVGSVGGIFAIPFQTLYSSAKAALELLGKGVRLEMRPFNVQCAVVMPGDVRTGFTAARRHVAAPCPGEYRDSMEHAVGVMARDEQRGMPPEAAARRIFRLAGKKRLPATCVVGSSYRLFAFLHRVLPYALVERLLARTYLPG